MGRVAAAEAVSDRTGAVVLLKGADTVVTVAGSGSTYINTTGNPGMATGGSGDVLTGVITAIAASGSDALDAARTELSSTVWRETSRPGSVRASGA